MFDSFYQTDTSSPKHYILLSGLATILPLSAWINFINVPLVLHLFELTGEIPFWAWAVTPGGRQLLAEAPPADGSCVLDKFGAVSGFVCLDGRYGEKYFAANPETLRLCVACSKSTPVPNDHLNMKIIHNRVQQLEVIHVSRTSKKERPCTVRYFASATSLCGWVLLTLLSALAIYLHCWLMLAYLVVVPLTGATVYLIRGSKPRMLRMEESGSQYNRVAVVAKHMNANTWQVFYGESTVVNRLLNWPLKPEMHPVANNRFLLIVLQGLILAQWALTVFASASQGWDAFLITFWVAFSLFANACIFTPRRITSNWMKQHADLRLERFCTDLSSRRALLNTIVALNPDTFAFDEVKNQVDYTSLSSGGLSWIDPILKQGDDRTKWEEATWRAMLATRTGQYSENGESDGRGDDSGPLYWHKFIPEGIEVANRIKETAQLSGRLVRT
ncbi:hypothetical protein NQ176_g3455 [Zarea fungicola]|uniref:Uncharacterized protein n=1 Tax=Zarea fungicola TaxID=93591 RepID=A0ACC1NJV5_9HYPO|nr:hypothetical protein NQ176_g3455 [Lecanicillium fungicola]